MDRASIARRDGVCDRDTVRDEHLDAGLELREWRKSSRGISSDLLMSMAKLFECRAGKIVK